MCKSHYRSGGALDYTKIFLYKLPNGRSPSSPCKLSPIFSNPPPSPPSPTLTSPSQKGDPIHTAVRRSVSRRNLPRFFIGTGLLRAEPPTHYTMLLIHIKYMLSKRTVLLTAAQGHNNKRSYSAHSIVYKLKTVSSFRGALLCGFFRG